MMTVADGDPVMWVNGSMLAKSTLGYLRPHVMEWNETLVELCETHPGMRVFDWADIVKPAWYGGDGIHYSPEGYVERGRMIAAGLVSAFPGNQPLPGDTPETGATGDTGDESDAAEDSETTTEETGPAAEPDCLVVPSEIVLEETATGAPGLTDATEPSGPALETTGSVLDTPSQ